jgi:hypothetical protein
MHKENLQEIERKIAALKRKLPAIGEMRPGSLTMQYKNPKTKAGGFYQISYTHHMKSRTEYVRPQFVPALKKQINTYKLFRNIVETWVELAIEHSKEKIRLAILKEKG